MHDTVTATPLSRRRSQSARALMIPLRSLMPLVAILIIVGTLFWGPWVSLLLAVALHFIVERTQ